MEETLKIIRSPAFWLCTVLVGLLGGIVVNYCQRGLDKAFVAWNAARTRRALAVDKRFNEDLHLLHHNPYLIQFSIAAENRHRLKGAFEAAMGFAIVVLGLFEPLFRAVQLTNSALLQVVFFLIVAAMTFARAWKNLRETAYHSTLLRVLLEQDREALHQKIGPTVLAPPSAL